jgi:hypothetical protein
MKAVRSRRIYIKKRAYFSFIEISTSVFELALGFSVRSGNVIMVGSQMANNEEYLRATEGHIFGLFITSRVLYYTPDVIKR